MAVATFDTLKFANTLKAAGVPPQQAEAQAQAFAEVIQINLKDLVTKDDLKLTKDELQREIDDAKKELKQEIKEVEQRLTAKIDTLAAHRKGEMVLLKWMLGVGLTVGVGILIRLFLFRGPV